MSMHDLIVRGGRLVTPDLVVEQDLVIDDGRISALVDRAARVEAREAFDATGRLVMAGMIDTHVHMRDPGHLFRETFATGTASAAFSMASFTRGHSSPEKPPSTCRMASSWGGFPNPTRRRANS